MYVLSKVYISYIEAATIDCNFDKDFCEWRQDDIDDFNWERESGNTASRYTGPTSDHTTGSKIYINHVECFNGAQCSNNLGKSVNSIVFYEFINYIGYRCYDFLFKG